MTRHDLREVVLVEEDELLRESGPATDDGVGGRAGVVPSDGSRGARGRSGRGRVRVARRPVAIAGAVALLVGGAVMVDGAREGARVARLAGAPGLLAPLGPDVGELWRQPAGWGQMATIGGDLVVGRLDAAGEHELVGLDAATGSEVWASPIPELDESGEIWCESSGDERRHLTTHVACRVVGVPERGGRRTPTRPADDVLLLVVDTRTGQRVVERTLETGYSAVESLGTDLALVEVLDDGHVRVVRMDPGTGQERWAFRSAEPLPTTDRGRRTPVPVLQHDVLLVVGETGWALSLDGELLGTWDLRGARQPGLTGAWDAAPVQVLPDGRFAVAGADAGGGRPGRYGTVSATDDADGFAIDGPVLRPAVDDGSAADVVLTVEPVDGGLAAHDAVTGDRLWARDADVRGDALLLDRRLVAVADDALTAVDVDTGDPLWAVPLGGGHTPRLMTDGDVVMGMAPGPDRVLVAWGVEDGRERWRAPLPGDAEVLRAIGGRLFAFGSRDVIALGLPGSLDGDDGRPPAAAAVGTAAVRVGRTR